MRQDEVKWDEVKWDEVRWVEMCGGERGGEVFVEGVLDWHVLERETGSWICRFLGDLAYEL